MKNTLNDLMVKVKNLPGEIWKPIEGTYYSVSNCGRIKRNRLIVYRYGRKYYYPEMLKRASQRIRHPKNPDIKDELVCLYVGINRKKTYRVARLVAKAFVANPDPIKNNQVNHKDENTLNNHASNLEWCDNKFNNNYGTKIQRQIERRRLNNAANDRTAANF